MTQATEIDIRELKTAIDGNTKTIEAIGRSTESNTRAVETIDRRLEALTRTTEANAKAIEANTKAIADLTSSVTGLREELRVGFSDVKGQITNLETKLDGKITNVQSKLSGSIDTLTATFDERTKGMGQRLDKEGIGTAKYIHRIDCHYCGGNITYTG